MGITLGAFGTSAPELFFNIISALHDNTEFALSNVSGSNLINICVGIGVSAMVASLAVPRQKFRKDLTIVEYLGLSESIVGLTVIAVGTSIPDCAASIIATAKNQKDIAVGNILGSNIFLVLASTIIVFGKPVAFSASNYFDYIAVCLLSIFLAAYLLIRQKVGCLAGFCLLACYPAILGVRIAFFNV